MQTMTFNMKGINGNACSAQDQCSLNYVWLACWLTWKNMSGKVCTTLHIEQTIHAVSSQMFI